ncbi:hypothetical protein APF79_04395 [bacterium BRH_c32]|nr:MAG: hypothetical protein APF79_04395 [bacterium BRH_c32]
MEKNLQRPKNWQDFESLCKKLWGEMWDCPNNIKKNGRSGQNQTGVDIYAIPKDEKEYYGIQCKCKDENLDSKITADDINSTLVKAINFRPKLKSLLIATTSSKDSIIEEYVRQKNLEYLNKDLFSIELYCWEDIVDLINENANTFKWYVAELKFIEKYDVDILFENAKQEFAIQPKFKRHIKKYNLTVNMGLSSILLNQSYLDNQFTFLPYMNTINKSWENFKIIMFNSGSKVLEDFKLTLELDGNYRGLDSDVPKLFRINHPVTITENYVVYKPNKSESLIVQKDWKPFILSILPKFEETEILIRWNFICRDFDKTGEIKLFSKPNYVDEYQNIAVYEEENLHNDEISYKDILEYTSGISI